MEFAQLQAIEDCNNHQTLQPQLEDYVRLSIFEKSFLREKAMVKWMEERDRNTQFFHRTIKTHTTRNKIIRLQDGFRNWTEDYEEVKNLAVNFFESLFTEPNPIQTPSLN